MIRKLSELVNEVKGGPRMTLAVAAGEDPATIHAISRAALEGLIRVVLIGAQQRIEDLASGHNSEFAKMVKIMHVEDRNETAKVAIQMVHDGEADVVMKGLVRTSVFMKAILDKEHGLLPQGGLLSHAAVMEVPTYPKLLIVSDAAIIPNPDLDQKIQILKYTIAVANAIGIELPKAALISAAETVSFKVQSSVDAAVITAMAQRKQIKGAIVDGPLALDVSLSPEHCAIKGLESPINGEADILIFPNIETANTFYKATTLLAHGKTASVVVGTTAPVVLTSRADDDDSKFYSIVLAARLAAGKFFKAFS